jgi:hypothetical protein
MTRDKMTGEEITRDEMSGDEITRSHNSMWKHAIFAELLFNKNSNFSQAFWSILPSMEKYAFSAEQLFESSLNFSEAFLSFLKNSDKKLHYHIEKNKK